jgi:hypothetical protein
MVSKRYVPKSNCLFFPNQPVLVSTQIISARLYHQEEIQVRRYRCIDPAYSIWIQLYSVRTVSIGIKLNIGNSPILHPRGNDTLLGT